MLNIQELKNNLKSIYKDFIFEDNKNLLLNKSNLSLLLTDFDLLIAGDNIKDFYIYFDDVEGINNIQLLEYIKNIFDV